MGVAVQPAGLLVLPADGGSVSRYLALFPELAPDAAYLKRFCGTASPWLAYGQTFLVLPDQPRPQLGLMIDLNPRLPGVATFHHLGFGSALVEPQRRAARFGELVERLWPWLIAHGATRLEGPLAFNTWHNRYRVFESLEGLQPYPGEVAEPPERNVIYAGPLSVSASYNSVFNAFEHKPYEALPCEAHGLSVRLVGRLEALAHLTRLFEIACVAFAPNYLLAPITLDEYLAIMSVQEDRRIAQRAIGLIEAEGELVGFFLAYGYRNERGQQTMIFKSVALLPAYQSRKATQSTILLMREHFGAMGYTHEIYALMRELNVGSQTIADKTTDRTGVRRYLLYGTDL